MASEAVALISSSADLSLGDPQQQDINNKSLQHQKGSLRCSRENLLSSCSSLHRSTATVATAPAANNDLGSNASSMHTKGIE